MLKIKRAIPAIMLLALAACVEATGPTSGDEIAQLGIEEAQDQDQGRSRGQTPSGSGNQQYEVEQ